MNEGSIKLDAYLTRDERAFLRMHYPDVEPEPVLDGYTPPRDTMTITIPEAAKLLKMTRSGAWKLCLRGKFESLRKVGPPDSPIYLLDVREVQERARARGGTT